jgi:hypothetical protein
MNYTRTLTPICGLLATALLAFAQTAPPAPPAVPAPMPAPAPAPAPLAPLPPIPPIDIDLGDINAQVSMAMDMVMSPELQDQMEAAREQVERMKIDVQDKVFANDEMMLAAKDMAMAQLGKFGMAFGPQKAIAPMPPMAPMPPTMPPMPAMPPNKMMTDRGRGMSNDRLYSAGQSALDNRHWDEALNYFGQVISLNTARVDGALYWKAYALGKLGRRDEAVATIAELRKSFASSRWLDDAKALELELKQASGMTVSPDAEDNEELKLMAINGLMQSDPDRAIPLLEGQLKGSASPKVKRNTLFVLAQSNSPKAQALIEQVARGGANPDLQLEAIRYMNERRKPNNNAQVLSEIYAATGDVAVKRAILQMYVHMREKDRLVQAAKTEKSGLRDYAIGALAGLNATAELWQLYQAETTTEGKVMLLRSMYSTSNAEKLLEVARTEKDPKVREEATRALATQKTGVTADTMVSLYNAEQDSQIKQSLVDVLCSQRNAKALVDIARSEKDTKMKLRIVERLSTMKSKEATDYLEELLKK